MHDYHEGLPDHVPAALLHSGCRECERRAKAGFGYVLSKLDEGNVKRLWERAAGEYDGSLRPADIDMLEMPFLRDVQAIQRLLQRLSDEDPMSDFSDGVSIPAWLAQTRAPE